MFFSIIIPVFNRPEELEELLHSLSKQTYTDFEAVVIEDGSSITAQHVIQSYQEKIAIQYIVQENTGQGFARNHGMRCAKGDFFVIFDSDVILPDNYLALLSTAIQSRRLDAFGGPDAAKANFSDLQKAMNFAMTSLWTTGGIRGKLKDTQKYQARGFNMGVSRAVFEHLGGFVDPNRGEDIEYSMRIKNAGFKLELVAEAFVYHKRKNTIQSFAKQAFSFGENRVNVSRYHPKSIKLVHVLPTLFLLFCISIPFTYLFSFKLFLLQVMVFSAWSLGVMINSSIENKSIKVGLLSWITSIIQLSSYGAGLLSELIKKKVNG